MEVQEQLFTETANTIPIYLPLFHKGPVLAPPPVAALLVALMEVFGLDPLSALVLRQTSTEEVGVLVDAL